MLRKDFMISKRYIRLYIRISVINQSLKSDEREKNRRFSTKWAFNNSNESDLKLNLLESITAKTDSIQFIKSIWLKILPIESWFRNSEYFLKTVPNSLHFYFISDEQMSEFSHCQLHRTEQIFERKFLQKVWRTKNQVKLNLFFPVHRMPIVGNNFVF